MDKIRLKGAGRARRGSSARPSRRTQEERRRFTQQRLIQAVIEVIRQKGYAGLRSRDITKASGLTWGAAQHLFGDKNELLLQVAIRVSDELAQRLDAHIEGQGAALRTRVAAVVRLIWDVYSSPDYFAMVEIVRGTRADARFHEKLVNALMRLARRIEHLWLTIFRDATISQDRSLACCNIVVLTLSGLASRKIYLRLSPQTNAILEELIDTVSLSLVDGKGEAREHAAKRVRGSTAASVRLTA